MSLGPWFVFWFSGAGTFPRVQLRVVVVQLDDIGGNKGRDAKTLCMSPAHQSAPLLKTRFPTCKCRWVKLPVKNSVVSPHSPKKATLLWPLDSKSIPRGRAAWGRHRQPRREKKESDCGMLGQAGQAVISFNKLHAQKCRLHYLRIFRAFLFVPSVGHQSCLQQNSCRPTLTNPPQVPRESPPCLRATLTCLPWAAFLPCSRLTTMAPVRFLSPYWFFSFLFSV